MAIQDEVREILQQLRVTNPNNAAVDYIIRAANAKLTHDKMNEFAGDGVRHSGVLLTEENL